MRRALVLLALFLSLGFGSAALAAPVELNTAKAEELAALPGLSAAKAEAIVAYRTKNGPFKKLSELDKVKGIGKATLEKLRPNLAINGQLEAAPAAYTGPKIDLNTATEKELVKLPGVGEAKARAIVAYREANGGFQSPEELSKVKGFSKNAAAKLADRVEAKPKR